MRNWIKNIIRESFMNDFRELHLGFIDLALAIESLEASVRGYIHISQIQGSSQQDHFDDNLKRLSTMANELKGTIAMARSGVRKKV